jgi:hypothetical protein
MMQEMKRKSHLFEMKSNWILINKSWGIWKKDTKKRNEKRELELLAINMRQEQRNMIKAIRHDRFRRLSIAILEWKQWISLQRQEKMIKIAHERRALKMQQFLMQLQNKHIQSIEAPPTTPSPKRTNNQHSFPCSKRGEPVVSAPNQVDNAGKERKGQEIKEEVPIPDQTKSKTSPSPSQRGTIIPKASHVRILKATKNDHQLLEGMQNREKLRLERKAELAKQKEERKKELEVNLNLEMFGQFIYKNCTETGSRKAERKRKT